MLNNEPELAKDRKVKHDFRLVKVDWTKYCGEEWLKENHVKECGVFYLIDCNLHVHICSFTPSLEAWPVQGYALPTDDAPDDGEGPGDVENEMLNSEELVSYFGTEVLRDAKKNKPCKYIEPPEEDETDEDYRRRVADEMREHLQGNPTWF